MFTASLTSLGYEHAWNPRVYLVFSHLLAAWLGYTLVVVLYRISPWHPLYAFPGPRLARATYLYEMYFDLYQGGQYAHQIRRLHGLYGPLVRINPDGIDCSDPYFIDEVYAGGSRKRNKPLLHVNHLLKPLRVSGFGTQDHDAHRRRREALRRFFSRAAVGRIERDLHGLAQQLGDRVLATGGAAFGVQDAMSCFTSDGIGLHSFGEPLGFLARAAGRRRQRDGGGGGSGGADDNDDAFFLPNLRRASFPIFTTFFVFRWLDLARIVFERFGAYLSFILPEETMVFKNLTDVEIPARIRQVKAEHDAEVVRGRETAFDALLDSDLPEHEKSLERLSGEAAVFLIAGTDTTSWTLTVATYHLLEARPDFLARLTAELRAAAPDARALPAQAALEQLPLLGAAVREALRLSYGVSGRSARVAPEEDLAYRGTWRQRRRWQGLRARRGKGEEVEEVGVGVGVEEVEVEVGVAHVIPRGTPVSMSSSILHHDEGVFPDSERFLPERWLDGEGRRRKDLERFLFSFSKGSRSCLGINLAYCELYLAMAVLVLRVYPRLRLYNPSIDDIKFDSDYFVPCIKKGREGLRAVVAD